MSPTINRECPLGQVALEEEILNLDELCALVDFRRTQLFGEETHSIVESLF